MDPIQPTPPSPHKPSMKDLENTGADQNGSPRLNLLRHDETVPESAPMPPQPVQPVQLPKPEPPRPIPAPAPIAPSMPKLASPALQHAIPPAKNGLKVPLIAGIVVVLLAGAGGGGWWYTQRPAATMPPSQPKTAVADPQPATPTTTPAETPTPTPTPQTVATPAATPSTGTPQTVTVQADHGLWLRSSPDSSNRSNIISWMPTNAQISVDQTGDFWWHGTYNGTPGYFASKYTK